MGVHVVEAGHDRRAAGIDRFRLRPAQRANLLVGPHGRNPVAADGHGLLQFLAASRVDCAVQDDQIGRRRRWPTLRRNRARTDDECRAHARDREREPAI